MIDLLELMEEICRQQEYGRYVLMGFFVTPEQFTLVTPFLEPVLPSMNACGGFRGIPVYIQDATPIPEGWLTETIRQVQFAYSQLDANCPLTIDLTLLDLARQLETSKENGSCNSAVRSRPVCT